MTTATDAEGRVWRRLQKPAPRARYEHERAWDKKNRRRANFVSKIDRQPGGCWVWTGQTSVRGNRQYSLTSYRERPGKHATRSAFAFMMETFFPEIELPHRTSPNCGVDLCINPLHRANSMVTNNVLTADQALKVYLSAGTDPREVAERFGISQNQVRSIWRGRNWRTVTGAPEHVPRRKVTPPEMEQAIRERKGTASSRVVGSEFGVSYKTVLRIWRHEHRPDLSISQDA